MLLITFSFLILALIISSIANEYAINTKRESITKTSESMVKFLVNDFDGENSVEFTQYLKDEKSSLDSLLTAANYYTDTTIFIVDSQGEAICSSSQESSRITISYISAPYVNKLFEQKAFFEVSNLGGALRQKCIVSAHSVVETNGACVGGVFICSESESITDFVNVMMKAIVLSTLSLMLGILIAVYFITERTVVPLKNMLRAVKSFSRGRMDARVPVSGNDEFTELSSAFNQMAESLENQENLRRSFLANVSHDLRTPMTTISGFVDGIKDGVIPPDKQDYYLDIISSETKRLSRLVSALLDISRMQAGERKFEIVHFDICEMARQILIGFEGRIEEKKLEVEFLCDKDNIFVKADKDAIYQILYNLCDNAIKFAYNGAAYRIKIKQIQNRKISVSVYNEGVGIPTEDLPFVFERFYKSDKSRGLDKTGVGLGLYIAKTIIDAHEEQIFVSSEYGKYCEFTFTLSAVR
ncbi:MAG: HAMP domain-containing histidine kinase [Clostridia bacterium]|nr:HAMP domain-containing histidine kinase [Clostridia bacterium]